jgi:hypothetical protein
MRFVVQACTNPGRQVAVSCTFLRWRLIILFLNMELLHATLLATGILRFLLDFRQICAPLS